MAFSLRWPVLCVWLHTETGGQRRRRGSSRGLGMVFLHNSGSEAMPKRRRSRIQIHAADGRLENAALGDDADSRIAHINAFSFSGICKDGALVSVQALKPQQLKGTLEILTDSFCDLLWGPLTYRPLLSMIVRENLMETQRLFPKNVVLVAMYKQDSTRVLVGTVEVYLNSDGVSSPGPPPDSPYLCNMAVKRSYRRKGIAWQLLKAAEELAETMGFKEMYLHCRLIDTVPLDIYKRAGYKVVSTSTIFSFLVLQRRKHLMRKRLRE